MLAGTGMGSGSMGPEAMPGPAMFAVSPLRSLQTRLTLAVLATLVAAFGLFYALMERALGEGARALLAQQQRATVALLASQAGMALEVRMRALEQVASDLAEQPHWDGRQAQALLRERPVLQTLFNTDVLAVRHDGMVLTCWPQPVPERSRVAPPLRVPIAAQGVGARRIWVDGTQGLPVLMLAVPVPGPGPQPAGYLIGRERTAGVGFLDALLSAAGQLPGRYAVLHWPAPGVSALALAQWRTGVLGQGDAALPPWPALARGGGSGADPAAPDWLYASHAIAATDWAVAAQAPVAELLAPVQQRQQRALLATLGISLGAVALCGWVIRRQLAPMRRAIATLAAQSQSDAPQALRLDARGRDEVGVLLQGVKQREQQRVQQEAAHRAALVREVHHRIKNNLQGILALLRQHAQRHPDLAAPLQQAIGQVQSISTLHGLQGRSAQAQVELGELVQAIAREVALLWERTVPVQLPPAWPGMAVAEREAVPLALVLHELLLNAIKHSSDPDLGVPVQLQDLPDGGAEIEIRNPGQWSTTPAAGQGLGLVSALMPRRGAALQQNQDGAWVRTRLRLQAPVLHAPSPPHANTHSHTPGSPMT